MAEMKLEGMDELMKRLQEMGRKGAAIERAALQAGGEVIRSAASERAPRSNDAPHLADNITISKIKTSQGMKYVLVGPKKGITLSFSTANSSSGAQVRWLHVRFWAGLRQRSRGK
nr:HK97-gp10 family putative phage morphogenesis protein [Paenibacillus mucilaginosus]